MKSKLEEVARPRPIIEKHLVIKQCVGKKKAKGRIANDRYEYDDMTRRESHFTAKLAVEFKIK